MITEIFGYKFKDAKLLQQALTHPSAKLSYNYEKLEFLGDRILAAVIAEYLFLNYSNETEGDLAKRLAGLVNGPTLAKIAFAHKLNEKIIIGFGENKTGGREKSSNLENSLEAIIGAIFLDGGGKIAKDIILKLWQEALTAQITPPQNPKSKLQEILQEQNLELPIYNLVERIGPDHQPLFKMELEINGYPKVIVTEKSKKAAQISLAEQMIKLIESKNA